LHPTLGLLGGFLVPDCTRKNNIDNKWQKNAQKNWMELPKRLKIKKILGMKLRDCG